MANLIKQAAGALLSGLTYANCGFTLSDFTSRANNGFVLASSNLDNSTALDLELQVSFEFEVGGTTTTGACCYLFLMPLNRDATTFGDGTITGSVMPGFVPYRKETAQVAVGITAGNLVRGTFDPIRIPPGVFRLGIGQSTGVALDATANAQVQARSIVLNNNG